MTITNFLNQELVDFASYSTLRAIGSLIDGQKNATRKIIHTIQKKNNAKDQKVEILAGIVSIETEYLHGPQNLNSVIVGLAQNYVGANNIPLLMREGNFGTRFEPEASAPRYIFTLKEPIFDKIFNKNDNSVLINQNFEGTDIEPRFFVPSLPLILINGSEGIATGFAQKILPRNVEDVKKYIKSIIDGKLSTYPSLKPYYNGFKGTILEGENSNQWLIKGRVERTSATRFKIIELPIGYNLKSYTKVLDDLEDKKIIRDFVDLSDNDKFSFEIVMDSKSLKNDDEWLLKRMKLVKSVTENFTVINENNRVVVYKSPEEVLNHYIRIKLEYLQKRKEYMLEEIKKDLLVLASKYIFIKNVTEENIKVNKVKKVDIITQLETYSKIIKVDNSYDYLLRIPIYNLTSEKIEELLEQIKAKKVDLSKVASKEINDTWKEEMDLVC